MANSVLIKLQAENNLSPELEKIKRELAEARDKTEQLDKTLKSLKGDKKSILAGDIKSEIDSIKKLQLELDNLIKSGAKSTEIKAKKREIERALSSEIQKTSDALKRQNEAYMTATVRGKKFLAEKEKENKERQKTTRGLKDENAIRNSSTNTLVRHIRQLETLAISILAVNRVYNAFIGGGINLQRQIESQTAGITALITANTRLSSGASDLRKHFETAGKIAQKTMKDIKKASVETAATFPELTAIFQQAIGGALGSGKAMGETIEKVIDNTITLSKRMSNIASAIGMPMQQVNEEIRSIIEGTIDINSRIAKMIGVTNDSIRKAKEEAGGLVKYLDEQLKAFDALASIQSFDRMMARVKDKIDNIRLDATEKAFEKLKIHLINLDNWLQTNSEKISSMLASVAEAITEELIPAIVSAGKFIVEWKDWILAALQAFMAFKVGGWLINGFMKFDDTLTKVSKRLTLLTSGARGANSALNLLKATILATRGLLAGAVVWGAVEGLSALSKKAKENKIDFNELNKVLEKTNELLGKQTNIELIQDKDTLVDAKKKLLDRIHTNQQILEKTKKEQESWGAWRDYSSTIKFQEEVLKGLEDELKKVVKQLENVNKAKLGAIKREEKFKNSVEQVTEALIAQGKIGADIPKLLDKYNEVFSDDLSKKISKTAEDIVKLSQAISTLSEDPEKNAEALEKYLKAFENAQTIFLNQQQEQSDKEAEQARRKAEEAKRFIREKLDAQINYYKITNQADELAKAELKKRENELNEQVSRGLITLEQKKKILHAEDLKRIEEREEKEKKAANEVLETFAKEKQDELDAQQKFYETIGNYQKAVELERIKIAKEFNELIQKANIQLTKEQEELLKKAAKKAEKEYFDKLTKSAKKAFKDIKGSWADTVSTMSKTAEEGFFDFFMQKTKSLKGALKDIGQGVFRDFISPYARSLSQGLSGGFGALLGGGSNLAQIASFYGLTKNDEGGFSGQLNGTDVVISGTGEILSGNSAFGGAGNILSAVSNLKSIYSMFSGGYSGLVSNFTTAPAGYLSSYLSSAGYTGASFGIQGLGAGAQHALTGNLIAGGGLNGTLSGAYGAGYIGGAALAGAGVGYGIGTLGDKLFKADTKAGTYGAIGGALGGAASAGLLGAQIGAFMGPFGMLIGAALGAIIGGMIGKWKTTDTGLFLDKGIAASLGQSTILSDVKRFEDQQKKTWFSKKEKTNFSDIDEETLKALNSAFAATKHALKGISATDHLYLREGKFSGNDFFNQNLAGAAISAFTGQLGKDSTHKSFAALADKEKKEIYEVILSTLGTIKQAVTEIDFIGIKNPIVSAAKVVENSIDTFKISTDGAFGEFSNILSISTDKFKEKYLNALRNDFTKENVDKWNAAKQAFEAVRKAQEDYTKAVISFTQQVMGIQSGFYGANKIDTTFLGLQSIYRKFTSLIDGLGHDINDSQRKEVAKFGSATDIHSWSKYLLSLSSDQMQAFLSEGNTELRQELVKVLTEHKQAIDASGGKEGWIKSLVELEALNKQIAGLKLAEQAEKTLQLQREQLNVLNLQKNVIEKLGSIAQRVRDSVIDHKTSGINYQFALERARVAWNNKDYGSKAFDNLSNAANHQQQYFKDTAKTYEEYKLNMLKMAGEIEAISDRTTLDDINKSIKKMEDLLNIGNKTIENQLAALEMQRQQLIKNSQSQIEAMDKLLGDNSSLVKYLKDVLDSLINKDTPKDAPKTQIPNYSSGIDTTNNEFRTANGALLLTKLDEQINQTYLSSLGRSVEQSGLEFWKNKINAGQMSITQLSGELIKSAIAITGSNNKQDWIEWYKSKGFKPFADGGIVTRPTAALIGEAGYPEAVLPLDGRTLKVDADNRELERLLREVIYLLKTQGKDMKELNLSFQNVTDGDKLFTKAM